MSRTAAALAGLLAATLLAAPCGAGEAQADELIGQARVALARAGPRTLRALVQADRLAAFEAVHRLGAAGDAGSLALARALAAAYGEVFDDPRLAAQLPILGAWTREERAARVEALRWKEEAKAEYVDGRPQSAVEKFEAARRRFAGLGDLRETAWCANAIAGLEVELKGAREGLPALEAARESIEHVGDLRLLAAVLHNLGLARDGVGDAAGAVLALERALELSHELGDRGAEARNLTTLGYLSAGHDPAGAIAYHRRSAAVAKAEGDTATEALARFNLGVLHRDRGELATAVAELRTSAVLARRVGADQSEAEAAWALALALREQGRAEEARGWLDRAEALAAVAQSPGLRAQVACVKSMALIEEGDPEAALSVVEAVVEATRAAGDPGRLAIVLECRAFALFYQGRYDEAVAGERAAVEAASLSAEASLSAWKRQSLGTMLALLGDLPGALRELESASALHASTESELGRCRILGILGALRERAGERERARTDLEQAIRCATEIGQAGDRADALVDLASLELKAGRLGVPAALARLGEAGELYRRQGNLVSHIACELLAAEAELLAGDPRAAGAILDRLAPLGRKRRGVDNEWRYQVLRARVAARGGDRAGAIRACERSIAEVEALRGELRRPPWRAALLDDRIEPYRELARLQLAGGDTQAAYRAARSAKARDLVRKLVPPSPTHEAALAPRAALPRADTMIPATRLGALLREREVLLDFFVLDDRVVVFVLKRQGLSVRRLPLEPAEARELAEVARYPGRPDPSDALVTEAWRGAVARLGAALLEPLAADLVGMDHVLVVPNAWLHSIPFAALPLAGRPLVEGRSIALLPAAETLFSRRRPRPKTRGLLALGGPDTRERGSALPGAATEVRQVARVAPGPAWVRTGAEASESTYRLRAAESEYIHLAAHGRIDRLAPLRSRIELAAGGGRDGSLTAEEIAALPVGAALVVLSGCDTAGEVALAGGEAPGDEREGLVRAFLTAGAGVVVATLWELDDAVSPEVFPVLYRDLAAERPEAAVAGLQRALRRGELRSADGRPLDHPFYWAGIVAYGAGR